MSKVLQIIIPGETESLFYSGPDGELAKRDNVQNLHILPQMEKIMLKWTSEL